MLSQEEEAHVDNGFIILKIDGQSGTRVVISQPFVTVFLLDCDAC